MKKKNHSNTYGFRMGLGHVFYIKSNDRINGQEPFDQVYIFRLGYTGLTMAIYNYTRIGVECFTMVGSRSTPVIIGLEQEKTIHVLNLILVSQTFKNVRQSRKLKHH